MSGSKAAPGLYPFTLDFPDKPGGGPPGRTGPAPALFPFIMDGAALEGARCALSSRSSGNMVYSPGEANPSREGLYRALGLDPGRVYACTQTHSRTVLLMDRYSPNNGPPGDGIISRDRELCLSVTVADCLPVYLYEPESGAFGLVHSGWKGTGIVLMALRLMEERWHIRPEELAAVLGPCICPRCYRVDGERARAFEAEFGGPGGTYPLGPAAGPRSSGAAAELLIGTRGSCRQGPVHSLSGEDAREPAPGYFIDLQAANARLLAGAGVRNIAFCRNCTFTDERLGSFRREGAAYTRMAALAGWF